MVGAWVVVVLLAGGAVEVLAQRLPPGRPPRAWPLLVPVTTGGGVLLPLAWVAFKVGALSSGGGFVIIPLMQADAVRRYHWMSGPQFLDVAGPAAIGAVLGAAVPLALALTRPWQYAVLVAAAVLLLVRRSGVVLTLVSAAAVGVGVVLAGGPLPS
jgi:Chromate transporter